MSDKVKFPKRNEDGSFCFVARFLVASTDALELHSINSWLENWIHQNQTWVWNYHTGEDRVHMYANEFRGIPVAYFSSDSHLLIRFEGQPTATKMWKDWLAVRIIPELRMVFPQIKDLLNVSDC